MPTINSAEDEKRTLQTTADFESLAFLFTDRRQVYDGHWATLKSGYDAAFQELRLRMIAQFDKNEKKRNSGFGTFRFKKKQKAASGDMALMQCLFPGCSSLMDVFRRVIVVQQLCLLAQADNDYTLQEADGYENVQKCNVFTGAFATEIAHNLTEHRKSIGSFTQIIPARSHDDILAEIDSLDRTKTETLERTRGETMRTMTLKSQGSAGTSSLTELTNSESFTNLSKLDQLKKLNEKLNCAVEKIFSCRSRSRDKNIENIRKILTEVTSRVHDYFTENKQNRCY